MKKNFFFLFCLLPASILILLCSACSNDKNNDNNVNNISYYKYYLVNSPNTNFTYTLDLENGIKDVFFIFTNTNMSSSSSAVSVQNKSLVELGSKSSESIDVAAEEIPVSGLPEATEFNENPLDHVDISNYPARTLYDIQEPHMSSLNDTINFYTEDNVNSKVPATCRKIVTTNTLYGQKQLAVWVANANFTTTGELNKVNQQMVDALAARFLKTGTDNDIYDWITKIFGKEWGDHKDSYLISEKTANNEISILLFDIPMSGVVGYFWGKDNYKNAYVAYSNQKIMFYMDAALFASREGTSWEITDYWPKIVISAIAHEAQHMVHFYQKYVVNTLDDSSEAWINEMCSMAAEDLVANKLGNEGPRGINPDDPSDGSSTGEVTLGRLPLYVQYNDFSVAAWNDDLKNYSINYAFGAYLGRNYGGSSFFKNVVQNTYTNYMAIENALAQSGNNIDFGTVLRKWGIANLLSDINNVEDGYRYNQGNSWFTDSLGFSTGSINMFNISADFKIYTNISNKILTPASNTYYFAGNNITGVHKWQIVMDSKTKLTVVVRDNIPQ